MSKFSRITNYHKCPCGNSEMLKFCSQIGFEKVVCARYCERQLIFKEGTFFSGLFMLASGKVKIYFEHEDNQEVIVALAKTGDLISHWGIGGDWVYPVSSSTLEDCVICYIPRDHCMQMFREDSEFAYQLMLYCSEELKRVIRAFSALNSLNSCERLASALVMIGDTFGIDQKTGEIHPCLSKKEIGHISGLSDAHLSRQLANLIKIGAIRKRGKHKILIRDYEQLRALTRCI